MKMVLETPRLTLRPFVAGDAATVYPWMTDEEIQRYMPTGRDYNMEQVEARVARYMSYQDKYGYSRWLIFDRATGEAICDAGILHIAASGEDELGYRLIKARWGEGLATEVAKAWMEYAIDEYGFAGIIALSLALAPTLLGVGDRRPDRKPEDGRRHDQSARQRHAARLLHRVLLPREQLGAARHERVRRCWIRLRRPEVRDGRRRRLPPRPSRRDDDTGLCLLLRS